MTNPQCPHGHTYGTCLMCYHDLVGEQQSEIEQQRTQWQQLNDQYMALRAQVAKEAAEIVTLRAALKVAQQSLIEFSAAQERGPSWYTNGKDGMYAQVNLWLRRGLKAVQDALGPYDENGQYLKEIPSAEPSRLRKRYFTHGDLLELPVDAEIDEFGRHEGNEVVYLASDVDK